MSTVCSFAFEKLKARYCLAVLVLAYFFQPGASTLQAALSNAEWYWSNVSFLLYAQALIALFIAAAIYLLKLDLQKLLGRVPRFDDLKVLVLTDVFLFCVACVLMSLFIPLSYLWPNFVQWWLSWVYLPLVYLSTDGGFPIMSNLLGFISVVVIAPIVEEIFFRGFLFHRWSKKWNIRVGIVASSVVFGLMHPDAIAAALFGVGMCLLYVRTQSLFVPIIAHSLYNFGIWLLELYGTLTEGLLYYEYSVQQFRDDWEWGAFSLLIIVAMVHLYLSQKGGGRKKLRLPAV